MNPPIIQIENLAIALSGNPILRDGSLSVKKGEYISIIEPNGAGKTTLIKCLAGPRFIQTLNDFSKIVRQNDFVAE